MLGRRGVGRVGRPSLVGTAARTAVVAGTATAVVGGVSSRQQAKAQQAAAASQPQQPPPAAEAPPEAPAAEDGSPLAQLGKLAELYQQGILNAEEFANKAVSILLP